MTQVVSRQLSTQTTPSARRSNLANHLHNWVQLEAIKKTATRSGDRSLGRPQLLGPSAERRQPCDNQLQSENRLFIQNYRCFMKGYKKLLAMKRLTHPWQLNLIAFTYGFVVRVLLVERKDLVTIQTDSGLRWLGKTENLPI